MLTTPERGIVFEESPQEKGGRNYLFFMGIDQYQHFPMLNNAVRGCKALADILTSKYQFDRRDLITLYNDLCTARNIHENFRDLVEKISPHDNLIIFFSGHGYFDGILEEGYWIPVDARYEELTGFMDNSRIVRFLKAIRAQHILLISDACFSGSLLANQRSAGYHERLSRMPSRWAIASGNKEVVSDGPPGEFSPFVEAVLTFLRHNDRDVSISTMAQHIKEVVSVNADQLPVAMPIRNVGDQGGEMILRTKVSGPEEKPVKTDHFGRIVDPISEIINKAAAKNFREVDLSGQGLTALPPAILRLKGLEVLKLGNNQINDISDDIQQLEELRMVDLSSNGLEKYPESLLGLPHLEILDLSHNDISQLPEHFGLFSNLRILNLRENRIQELPDGIGKLSRLEQLALGYNKLKSLPSSIGQLTKLEILDLAYNQLSELPPDMGILVGLNQSGGGKLRTLDLAGNLLGISDEILQKSTYNLIEFVFDLQASKNEGTERALDETKLIVVGSGAVGKTSIIKMLTEGQYDPYEKKTEGIEVKTWSVDHPETQIKVNIWDFGGQEIMHSTHRFFMTNRSIYLIVVTPREFDRSGETDLDYWLKLVRSYTPKSPVIVAINKCETHPAKFNKYKYLDPPFEVLNIVETSCADNIGFDRLVHLVGEAVESMPHIRDIYPASYFRIKQKLEGSEKDYISYTSFADMCQVVDPNLSADKIDLLGSLLHDMGIILNFRRDLELSNTYVLNPIWVTQGVYAIINAPLLSKKHGVLDVRILSSILNPTAYPPHQHAFLLHLMEFFGLCYRDSSRRGFFFVPAAFNHDYPKGFSWDSQRTLRFQFEYDILPTALFEKLIVRCHAFIDGDQYWKSGFVIDRNNTQAYIEADYVDRKIRISVRGEGSKRDTLAYLRAHISDINSGYQALNIQEKIPYLEPNPPYQEVYLDYQELKVYEETNRPKYFISQLRIEVSVKALLNGVDVDEADDNSVRTLLFLSANPTDTGRLRLATEYTRIEESIASSKLEDQFKLEQQHGAQLAKLPDYLMKTKPQIVHFSGHGIPLSDEEKSDDSSRSSLDWEAIDMSVTLRGGLAFQDDSGHVQTADHYALANLFGALGSIECVILNACFSAYQAEAINRYVPYVIGSKRAIDDEAAILFAQRFYVGLGADQGYEAAFEFARMALKVDPKFSVDSDALVKHVKG